MLATVTLCVVGFAISYYMLVAWSEVVGGLIPALRCKFISIEVGETDEGASEERAGVAPTSQVGPV